MKVLYLGHYKEFGGWAQAATDYILALDSVGVDVVPRNVTLTEDKENVHPRLLELEKKSSKGCDFCVQHVLPHHITTSQAFKKNVAYMATETLNINHLNWFYFLQNVDEVWVPNKTCEEALSSSQTKIKVVPHTFDPQKFRKPYRELSIPEAKDTFKFYYIGDYNDRKNLESIVTCFHSEFEEYENVSLVLKLNKFGIPPEELHSRVGNFLNEVKSRLRIRNSYKQEIVITEVISEEQLYSLHQYCDCFICPSRGEGWSIPTFDAMVVGNTPIASNFGGPTEFIDKSNWRTGTLVNGSYSCCKSNDAAFPDIFTSREYWFHPCEKQIREQMRKYYEGWKNNPVLYKQRNQAAGFKQSEKFSYQKIGNMIKENLNG